MFAKIKSFLKKVFDFIFSSSDTIGDYFEISPISIFYRYAKKFVISLLTLWVLNYYWGEYILMQFSQLNKGPVSLEGMTKVAPFFLPFIIIQLFSKKSAIDGNKSVNILKGIWLSLNAGFWEELIYRWLTFFIAMIFIPFISFITFGIVGLIYRNLAIPFVNWITLGFLSPQLLSANWVLGASLISSAYDFMDDHSNKSLAGKFFVWVHGLVLFWLIFNYGIYTAIAVHVIYDALLLIICVVKSRQPTSSEYIIKAYIKD